MATQVSFDVLLKERELLRSELSDLKQCQIRYFSLSVGATGLLFGIASRTDPGSGWLLYVAPIAIILPCWWIFFDKATTVSRIVGYLRVLEKILCDPTQQAYVYIGWENALRKFRDKVREGAYRPNLVALLRDVSTSPASIAAVLFMRSFHRYWVVNWFTFFGLALASLSLAVLSLGPLPTANLTSAVTHSPLLIGAVLVLHTASATGNLLRALCDLEGSHSYRVNEKRWRELLAAP